MDLTAEQIDALAELGISQDRIEELKGQMSTAQETVDRPGPGMRQAGRVLQAANPMEHLGDMIKKYRASRQMPRIQEQIGQARQQQADTRGSIMDLIRNDGQPPAPAAPPPGSYQGGGLAPGAVQAPRGAPTPVPPYGGGGMAPQAGAQGAPSQQEMMAQMLRRGGSQYG